ncbi:MAG: phosphoribosylglycinamide formyltransferase [Gammaproteobacteria bacterium]|nr:phosphoribosylglycinamide formyltransferase [Gammaproteobacteria bacterium]
MNRPLSKLRFSSSFPHRSEFGKSSNGLPIRIAVLISGNGSNLQAMIDAIDAGTLPAKVVVVISNKADAYGLDRAKKANIPTEVISHSDYDVLAGFMRILTSTFVEHFKNRILNIHPSLLPKYPGLHTHKQVLAAGDLTHGATVHIVTSELDAGPILGQMQCNVAPNDTAETLKQKVQQLEYQLYPEVIKKWAEK